MERETWVLVDGQESYGRKFMTDEEAEQANRRAQEATGGSFFWVRESSLNNN